MSSLTDIYVRNRYTGTIHRVGDDQHDMLIVDKDGTIHYQNLQCGDGCVGYKSMERVTLSDKYPDMDWKERANEFVYGYEFVPNEDDYGYNYDPREEES